MGDPPDQDHREFFAGRPGSVLVRRRPQLPGGASPVPADQPCALSRAQQDRGRKMQGVQSAVQQPAYDGRGRTLSFPLHADAGNEAAGSARVDDKEKLYKRCSARGSAFFYIKRLLLRELPRAYMVDFYGKLA